MGRWKVRLREEHDPLSRAVYSKHLAGKLVFFGFLSTMHSGAQTQGISDGAASLLNRGGQTPYSDRNVQRGLQAIVATA
jgi:hypothetical protein